MYAFKMLLLTLSALFVIAAAGAFQQKPCFDGGDGYTFYCGTSSADCKSVTATNPAAEKLRLKNVCGESADFESFNLSKFLKEHSAEVVFTEELDGGVNYYCTADLPYSVNLYGKEINLHVCVRGDSARVASPIIFGGY